MQKTKVYKIEDPVHTASTLACPLQNSEILVSAIWMRHDFESQKIVKAEKYKESRKCTYECSLFDYGASIKLICENHRKGEKIYEYTPVCFSPLHARLYQNAIQASLSLEVNVFLNKNEELCGRINVSSHQQKTILMALNLGQSQFSFHLPRCQLWSEYEDILKLDHSHKNRLKLKLDSNNTALKQKLNIPCHGDEFLSLGFRTQIEKEQFLIFLLRLHQSAGAPRLILSSPEGAKNEKVQSKALDSSEASKTVQTQCKSKILESEIDCLFASHEDSFPAKTPNLCQGILQEIKDVIFTPQQTVEMGFGEYSLANFDKFIRQQSETKDEITQSISFQFDSKAKKSASTMVEMGTPDSYQHQIERRNEENIAKLKLQEVLKKNKQLEERNSTLQQENAKLKSKLSSLILLEKDPHSKHVPSFIKSKQISKKLEEIKGCKAKRWSHSYVIVSDNDKGSTNKRSFVPSPSKSARQITPKVTFTFTPPQNSSPVRKPEKRHSIPLGSQVFEFPNKCF